MINKIEAVCFASKINISQFKLYWSIKLKLTISLFYIDVKVVGRFDTLSNHSTETTNTSRWKFGICDQELRANWIQNNAASLSQSGAVVQRGDLESKILPAQSSWPKDDHLLFFFVCFVVCAFLISLTPGKFSMRDVHFRSFAFVQGSKRCNNIA